MIRYFCLSFSYNNMIIYDDPEFLEGIILKLILDLRGRSNYCSKIFSFKI